MQEFFCFGEDFFANAAANVKRSLLRCAPPRLVVSAHLALIE
jgi:hypothetical protein